MVNITVSFIPTSEIGHSPEQLSSQLAVAAVLPVRNASNSCLRQPICRSKPTRDYVGVPADVRQRFGVRLRQLRKKRGWTQAAMADILSLDRSYLAEIEEGKRNVCLMNIEVIAEGLGLTLAQLLSRV